jgi:hypothetical protein
MRTIPTVILLFAFTNLFAQDNLMNNNTFVYRIHLTTMHDNMLKGLLTGIKDSSLLIYPGKRKEWANKTHYSLVEFNYANIRQVALKRKNSGWRGMLIGGGIGTAIFASSFLISNQAEKNHPAVFAFFAIPAGIITGAIAGSIHRKNFRISGTAPEFQKFQKEINETY